MHFQKGSIQTFPLLIVIAAVGLISFLLITSVAPFKQRNLAQIFSKSVSEAAFTTQSFGINAHLMWQGIEATRPDLDRMKQDGVSTVRFDLPWIWLEPNQKGVYDAVYLQRIDDTMAAIASRGMQPIVTFLQPPTWALSLDCIDQASHLCPPQNVQDYADTYAFLANRYKTTNPNVVWEVWNEPNDVNFWRTTAGPNAGRYTQLLQATFTSVKQVAPQSKVIGGVIAFNDQNFLNGMYAAGAKGYFDGLDIHPYARNHPPADMSEPFFSFKGAIEQMEANMAQHGEPGKPIYITEMGWDSVSVSDPTLRASFYQQAVQLVKTYPYIMTLNPYTFKVVPGDTTSNTAALVVSGVATPAWTAYITEIPKPGTIVSQPAVNLLQNSSFEQNPPNFLPWSFAVTNGTAATLGQDLSSATNGNSSAVVTITTPAPSFGQSWFVQLRQIGQAITQDQPYTISFDAKSSAPEQINMGIQQASSPYVVYYTQNVNLTPSWARFTYTFNSPVTNGLVMATFNVGGSAGKVWIDNVLFCTPVACSNGPLPTSTPSPTPTPSPAPTATPSPITTTIFGNVTPSFIATDTNPYELGLKFRSTVAGRILGVRYYKSAQNTGTHTASLWSRAGAILANATFINESSVGWQQVLFPTPVQIQPNTTYVVSYHTNVGRYAQGINFFGSTGVTSGPLTALRDGVDGTNGVYAFGTTTAFPNLTWNTSNYYVDVIFQ